MPRLSTLPAVVALCGLVLVLTAGPSNAQSLLEPEGLSPGDQYRVLFITEGRRDAASDQISDYNDFVNAEAARTSSVLAGLPTTFSAVGSTATVDAIDNIALGGGADDLPIFLVDGTLFATSSLDLFDGSYGNDVFRDQFSFHPHSVAYWTGSSADGRRSPRPLGPSHANATLGVNQYLGLFPIIPTSALYPVTGVSGALTVVPEPSTAVLFSLAALGGLIRRRRCSLQS